MALEVGFYGEELNLLIKQGADFILYFQMFNPEDAPLNAGDPVNLTGAVIHAHLRRVPTGKLVATFAMTIVDAVNGKYNLFLGAEDTGLLTPVEDVKSPGSRYVWDMKMVLGTTIPLYYGVARVLRSVTHDD